MYLYMFNPYVLIKQSKDNIIMFTCSDIKIVGFTLTWYLNSLKKPLLSNSYLEV